MAAPPFDPSRSTTLFDIYNDSSLGGQALSPIPAGACNFVDLTPGANGHRCGCRRFWTRNTVGSPVTDHAGWCMCNHHACFHDEGPKEAFHPTVGQENEKPRSGREPLSPMLDTSFKNPTLMPGSDFPSFGIDPSLSFLHDRPTEGAGVQANRPPASYQTMPDTLDWGAAPADPGHHALPPIPSQCLIPSQATSTTSTTQMKYARPFGGKGLQTLESTVGRTKEPSPLGQQQLQVEEPKARSAQHSSDAEGSFIFVTPDEHKAGSTQAHSIPQSVQSQGSGSGPRKALRDLSDVVSGHEQRLDRLETVSFSATGHEECHEKHDHTDLRLTELETKFEDFEKVHNDNGSVITRKNDDTSTVTDVSVATTNGPTFSQELYSQVQLLQAQVSHLQSFVPSTGNVWELEVVYLPFPLKRVWQELDHFKSDATSGSEPWTQMPMTHSSAASRAMSAFGEWENANHDAEWLRPRAHADSSITDKRLRSRGLVKTISIREPNARSVHAAMEAAFGSAWNEMGLAPRPALPHLSRFLGLQSPWVPLRKVHKDSRLRFLSPGEMLTPSTWNVEFLHSVMMRSSQPRLFVTHPDAYIQDQAAYEAGWTWQRVREMDRVYPDVTESQETPEADALEQYWAWSDALDEPPSAHTSMSMRHRRRQTSVPPESLLPKLRRSASPYITRGQSPMIFSRAGSRPPPIRTVSGPMSASALRSPAESRRRVVSYGHNRRTSTASRALSAQFAVEKRRRARSPSYHRFTPRCTASPSPMPFPSDRQPTRGTTPAAYPTPYSNAPLQEVRPLPGENDIFVYPSDEDDDLDYDIDIYESASASGSDAPAEAAEAAEATEATQDAQPRPEDEPWPGFEDMQQQGSDSDGENVDPDAMDHDSNASSQPSEYPSTQRAWPRDEEGFEIHVDDENER